MKWSGWLVLGLALLVGAALDYFINLGILTGISLYVGLAGVFLILVGIFYGKGHY